jgi:hypothetical protein
MLNQAPTLVQARLGPACALAVFESQAWPAGRLI